MGEVAGRALPQIVCDGILDSCGQVAVSFGGSLVVDAAASVARLEWIVEF